MTILNLMLGKGRGGLEQAVLDYAEALALAAIPALTIISPNAWVEPGLVNAGVAHESIINRGQWDIFAARRLRAIAKKTGATAIICHGNRAIALALKAFTPSPTGGGLGWGHSRQTADLITIASGQLSPPPNLPPAGGGISVIAVAHNYSNRRFARADGCFAITQHLADTLAALGAKHIVLMPNMVRIRAPVPRPAFRAPPVIGTMGRLVAKKGFKTWIEALSILRNRGVAFRAILGGDGEESAAIDALITGYQLNDRITRIGWVKDKDAFFESLDLFVLPSKHEAFGIVLIEAMNHSLPVISTRSEGPSEIIHNGIDGILVPMIDPEKLADAMAQLLTEPARAAALGTAGRVLVATEYSMDAMARRLQMALAHYISKV